MLMSVSFSTTCLELLTIGIFIPFSRNFSDNLNRQSSNISASNFEGSVFIVAKPFTIGLPLSSCSLDLSAVAFQYYI